jgi:hypothetical protein
MSQNTKPAPFNLGDHVRYVGKHRRALPASHGNEPELLLVAGMEGVILLSTGAFSEQGEAAPNPWHCRVQFQNGIQVDINPESHADFEAAHGAGASSV